MYAKKQFVRGAVAGKRKSLKRKAWRNYHIVDFRDLHSGTACREQQAEEINLRVAYAKAYHKGKFDSKHHHVLQKLSHNFDITDKLNLTLDACIAVYDTRVVKRTVYRR
jgi:hypothetical protein